MELIDLNSLVAFAFILLAITSILMVAAIYTLVPQVSRTLIAYEKLADTVQVELRPTLAELKEVMAGVNQLRSVTTQRVTDVSHQVETVAGSFEQVASKAKKRTSVWGTGLLAGLKAYLTANHEDASHSHLEQILDKGEQNVGLKQ